MRPLGHKFPNIFEEGKKIYTKPLVKGKTFPDEIVVRHQGKPFRQWDPTRSKLCAGLMKGISQIGLKEEMKVLYLGAAHGYTASYISDIIRSGMIFAVDVAPQVLRDLIFVSHRRKNMAPILFDASDVEGLKDRVPRVDYVFQDIAQRNQTQIFIRNCKAFLKPGGFAALAVKARSIDVSKKPKIIFKRVRKELEEQMTIVDYRELDPFEKDHCMFICKR